MRGVRYAACLFALALSAPGLLAAPPDAPRELKAEPGQLVRIPVKGAAEIGYQPAFADDVAFFDELAPRDGQRRFVFQAQKPGSYAVVFWTKGETTGTVCTITVGTPPKPGPDPAPPPKPKPDPPKPVPVTTFRVILVFESAATITAAQLSVLYGKEVEAYLDRATTRDDQWAGWRRRDKDTAATGDTPSMNTFWSQAKTKVTSVPCIAIQVNGGEPVIEALPATPAATIELLKKYAEGK